MFVFQLSFEYNFNYLFILYFNSKNKFKRLNVNATKTRLFRCGRFQKTIIDQRDNLPVSCYACGKYISILVNRPQFKNKYYCFFPKKFKNKILKK